MSVFFFNDTATTEIYTLSLHDALPISGTFNANGSLIEVINVGGAIVHNTGSFTKTAAGTLEIGSGVFLDRNSTRLNSSHTQISNAVFCLKKTNGSLAAASVEVVDFIVG